MLLHRCCRIATMTTHFESFLLSLIRLRKRFQILSILPVFFYIPVASLKIVGYLDICGHKNAFMIMAVNLWEHTFNNYHNKQMFKTNRQGHAILKQTQFVKECIKR